MTFEIHVWINNVCLTIARLLNQHFALALGPDRPPWQSFVRIMDFMDSETLFQAVLEMDTLGDQSDWDENMKGLWHAVAAMLDAQPAVQDKPLDLHSLTGRNRCIALQCLVHCLMLFKAPSLVPFCPQMSPAFPSAVMPCWYPHATAYCIDCIETSCHLATSCCNGNAIATSATSHLQHQLYRT